MRHWRRTAAAQSARRDVIAYCISDPRRARVVEDALRGGRYRLEPVRHDAVVPRIYNDAAPGLLLHDLFPFNANAVQQIRHIRQASAGLPILLYPPVEPGVASLLLECGRVPLVHAELQLPGGCEDLRRVVQRVLTDTPAHHVWQVLSTCIAGRPRAVGEFFWLALNAAQRGCSGDLQIDVLASKLATERRTLERLFARFALPSPRRLRDWCVYLLVAATADSRGARLGDAAGVLGLDPKRLALLRKRLLPGTLADHLEEHAGEAFSVGCVAVMRECSSRRLRWSRFFADRREQRLAM